MLLSDLSWEQVREYVEREDRLILPMGAVEQHGRQLGIGCDYLVAEKIAQVTGEQANVAVAPALAYGMSLHHMKFAGTMSLRPMTLTLVVEDLMRSVYTHGFRRVLVVNGHGGNTAAIDSALSVVTNELAGLRVKLFEWWKEPEILQMVDEMAGPQQGTHASPAETAFMLVARSEGVHMERAARRDTPSGRSREFLSAERFAATFPDGVMGLDPSAATVELGSRLLEKSVEFCTYEIANW